MYSIDIGNDRKSYDMTVFCTCELYIVQKNEKFTEKPFSSLLNSYK